MSDFEKKTSGNTNSSACRHGVSNGMLTRKAAFLFIFSAGCALICIGILFLIFGTKNFGETIKIVEQRNIADATIVKIDEIKKDETKKDETKKDETKKDETKDYMVFVSYEADGRVYTTELGTYVYKMAVGDTIQIYYDSIDPRVITMADSWALIYVFPVAGGILIGAGVMFLLGAGIFRKREVKHI